MVRKLSTNGFSKCDRNEYCRYSILEFISLAWSRLTDGDAKKRAVGHFTNQQKHELSLKIKVFSSNTPVPYFQCKDDRHCATRQITNSLSCLKPSLPASGVAMYMVYWTEIADETRIPYQELFPQSDLRAALAFMEKLRQRQRAGESVGFVVMSSENPDSVGHAGVADPHPDYKWMKRRKQ